MLKTKNSFSFFVYLFLCSYLFQFLNALSDIMDSSIAMSD